MTVKSTKLWLVVSFSVIMLAQAVRMSTNSASSITNDDDYWTGLCLDTDILQSPINILPPFTYIDFDATFSFYPQQNGVLVNNGGHYLKMEGDFGYFEYKDTIFDAYLLHFVSPSEHTIGTTYKKFPMELQIYATSQDGLQINIAILFSTSTNDGDFLTKLGFGNGDLEYLEDDQSYEAPHPVDISKVIPSNNDFFIYEGTNTYPSCEPAIWFLSFETFKISERQLNDFPKKLLNQGRPQQSTQGREIYVTFSETKYEALQSAYTATTSTISTASSSSSTSTSSTSTDTVVKNELYDAFTIVGDSSVYNDTIYPFSSVSNTPRPIRTGDYLVVTNPNTTAQITEMITLNDATINSAIAEIEKLSSVSTNSFTQTHKINVSESQIPQDVDLLATAAIQLDQKTSLRGKSSSQAVLGRVTQRRDTNSFFSGSSSKSHKSQGGYSFLALEFSNQDTLSSGEDTSMKQLLSKTTNFFKAVDEDAKIQTYGTGTPAFKSESNLETGLLAKTESNLQAGLSDKPITDAMIETAALSAIQANTATKIMAANSSNTTNTSNTTLSCVTESDGVEVTDTDNWPDLCQASQLQSPINIDLNDVFQLEAVNLTFNYVTSNTTAAYSVTNDGYKIVINGSFGEMLYGDHPFEAYSLHLHHPSEHTFGGNKTRSDFELQILHYDDFGLQTIVAALFDSSSSDGEESDFLTTLGLVGTGTEALSVGSTNVITGLDLLSLVSDAQHYISYIGSITSPPCTDNVKWFILNKQNSCSSDQVNAFATFFGENSNVRGLQPLNQREFSVF